MSQLKRHQVQQGTFTAPTVGKMATATGPEEPSSDRRSTENPSDRPFVASSMQSMYSDLNAPSSAGGHSSQPAAGLGGPLGAVPMTPGPNSSSVDHPDISQTSTQFRQGGSLLPPTSLQAPYRSSGGPISATAAIHQGYGIPPAGHDRIYRDGGGGGAQGQLPAQAYASSGPPTPLPSGGLGGAPVRGPPPYRPWASHTSMPFSAAGRKYFKYHTARLQTAASHM